MRILYSPLAAIFLSVFVGVISLSLYLNAVHIQQSEHFVTKLETEVATIEGKVNLKVAETVEATASAAKERMYRDQLLMQKPGEFVLQIPELPSPKPTPVVLPQPLKPWSQWKKILF